MSPQHFYNSIVSTGTYNAQTVGEVSPRTKSLVFEPIAPGHCFQFDSNCVGDRNNGARLEFKAGSIEYANFRRAARREPELYGIDPSYVAARMEGRELRAGEVRRTWKDWSLICATPAIFVWLGMMASVLQMEVRAGWLFLFGAMLIAVFVAGAVVLWPVTRFS